MIQIPDITADNTAEHRPQQLFAEIIRAIWPIAPIIWNKTIIQIRIPSGDQGIPDITAAAGG